MTQLSTDAAITRFQQNEERVDKFANELGTYLASNGVSVLTIRQFIANMISRYYAFNVKGAWATATVYAVQDIVSQGGVEYMCLVAHTAGTFATDLAAKKWVVFQGVTQAGAETMENKSFKGGVSFFTNGGRIGITGASTPNTPSALVDIDNDNVTTCALRVTSTWTGSTASPFVNNDDSLWETFNRVLSNSTNYSWSISAPNAYNDIPAGVRDGGERVGVYGWATSVSIPGSFEHRGTLASQIGVRGRAGYQGGVANPAYATAVIESAIGVKGEIYGELAGPTVVNSYAGHFTCVDQLSTIQNNYAIFASARAGTVANYSFYGESGVLFNANKAVFGGGVAGPGDSQFNSNVSVRGINGLEFGNPDPTGYGSAVGATASSGYPFLAFNAEADQSGDTFRTRGKKGAVVMGGLDGSLSFGRITNANASGQGFTEDMRLTAGGKVQFQETILLRSKTPETSTSPGTQGEFMWDENYFYMCVATNTWKRSPLSTW